MLVSKQLSVGWRVAAVGLWTAGVTAVGVLLAWAGGVAGLWDWPPRPSSAFGVALGLLLAAIVAFEMGLYFRKVFRRIKRVGTARRWMWVHLWLGLVGLPVALVHAGFGFGGPLPAVTLGLFVATIASGVWGLLLQQWLPEKLLDEIPDETVASQADETARYYLGRRLPDPAGGPGVTDHTGEVYRLVEALVKPPPEPDELFAPPPAAAQHLGATAAALRAEPLLDGKPAADLVAFRDDVLVPYLEHGAASGSPIAARSESGRRFARLRALVPAEAQAVMDRLEILADVRRRWDTERRINGWLHGWVPVHLLLSVAMTGMMVVHAVRALKYW